MPILYPNSTHSCGWITSPGDCIRCDSIKYGPYYCPRCDEKLETFEVFKLSELTSHFQGKESP